MGAEKTMKENLYWLWLSMVFGDSTHKVWELMGLYESAEEACAEIISGSNRIRLSEREKNNVKAYSFGDAEKHFENCASRGIGIAAYSDIDYPNQLRFIADPPTVLYYKGNIGCVSGSRTVVSVGTRKASEKSIETCRKICTSLADNGYIIVSGFAAGIDIASHVAAAESGMPTACVLGCGVNYNYPKENFKYRDMILSSGGVFISEYPPETSPFKGNFPKRNRIMTGIGRAVMVFEAPESSGSMITARLSAEHGRELFVLPPADIFSGSFGGNIKLLRDGAIPLMNVSDIYEYFRTGSEIDTAVKTDAFEYVNMVRNRVTSVSPLPKRTVPPKISTKSEKTKKPVHNVTKEKIKGPNELLPVNDVQKKALELLKAHGKMHADAIGEKLGADPFEIVSELTELELMGFIKSHIGGVYEYI